MISSGNGTGGNSFQKTSEQRVLIIPEHTSKCSASQTVLKLTLQDLSAFAILCWPTSPLKSFLADAAAEVEKVATALPKKNRMSVGSLRQVADGFDGLALQFDWLCSSLKLRKGVSMADHVTTNFVMFFVFVSLSPQEEREALDGVGCSCEWQLNNRRQWDL